MTISPRSRLRAPQRSTRLRVAHGRGSIAVGLLAAAGLVAGCTGAATPAPTTAVTPTGSPSTATSSPAGSPAASVAANALTVSAREYAFDMPSTAVAGLTTISLKNNGAEEHQAQVAKLNDNVTLQQFQTALQNPDPSAALGLVTLSGGPTGVAPGATGVTTSNLTPGNYVFLCFVPAPDGLPHIAKGMVAPLQVTGTASTAQLPTTEATVNAKDFAFEGLTTLKAGKQRITFNNTGPQPHEATLVKLQAGVTVDMLKQMMAAPAPSGAPGSPAASPDGSPAASGGPGAGGPPPWTPAGGIAGVTAGTRATFEVDVTAGDYAFVCFIPDPASGKAHVELGMISGVTVQ